MRRRIIALRIVRGCWAALFLLQIGWWGWLAPQPPVPRWLMVALTAGPLLVVARGLAHDRIRAYFWFNLLVLPYFALGVAAVWSARGDSPLGWAQLVLAVTAFAAGFWRTKLHAAR